MRQSFHDPLPAMVFLSCGSWWVLGLGPPCVVHGLWFMVSLRFKGSGFGFRLVG